jgi:hypothetical protein
MPVERTAGSSSLVDVLDRVLDRGLRWGPGTASGRSASFGSATRVVVTFLEVRAGHGPAREAPPPDPSPGA